MMEGQVLECPQHLAFPLSVFSFSTLLSRCDQGTSELWLLSQLEQETAV